MWFRCAHRPPVPAERHGRLGCEAAAPASQLIRFILAASVAATLLLLRQRLGPVANCRIRYNHPWARQVPMAPRGTLCDDADRIWSVNGDLASWSRPRGWWGSPRRGRAQPIAAGRLWQRRKSGPPGMQLMTARDHPRPEALDLGERQGPPRGPRSARVSPGQSPFVNCSQLNTVGLYHVTRHPSVRLSSRRDECPAAEDEEVSGRVP
jgi:hypothetical protein